MADSRALTIQSGQVQQIANADALIVGDGILTPSASGNDLTLTPDGSDVIIGSGKTLDAATLDRAGTIDIGTTAGTTVTIGRTGQAASMPGALSVTEGITSFGLLNARGNVDLGDAASDTVSMIGQVDTDMTFADGSARSVSIDTAADDTAGDQLSVSAGNAGANPTAARVGGALFLDGGDGAAGAGGFASGAGGSITAVAGDAGSDGGGGQGNGGSVTIDAGVGGTNGTVSIGGTNASALTIGRVGVTTTVAGALTVAGVLTAQSTTQFQQDATFQGNVTIGDTGGDTVNFGGGGGVTATGNPTWNFGTGQADFGGNLDANAGLDVSGGAMTFTGTNIDLDPTGTFALDMDSGQTAQISVSDNQSSAFSVREGLNPYVDINTTNGSEAITLGNGTTNPTLTQNGTGQVTFNGNVDAGAGLDVTGTLTVGGIPITQSGDALLLGGTSTTDAPAPVSLTTTERDALTPVDGMFIWNETTSNFQWYDGSSWESIPTGASAGGWTDDGGTVRLPTSSDDVAIGTASLLGTERLRVLGDVGIQGDIDFETGGTRSVSILAAAADAAGNQLTVAAGAGGVSSGVGPGGTGGSAVVAGGAGGATDGTLAGGVGGTASFSGGAGGAGGLSNPGGVGGAVTVSGGTGGVSGGGGAGVGGALNLLGGANGGGTTDGVVNLATSQTSALNVGGGGATIDVNLVDNSATAFVMEQGTDDYFVVDTTNGSEGISLGNATTNPTLSQLGTGQVSFAGNVNATAGLDVTTAALTAAAGLTVSGGAIDLDPSTFALNPTGALTIDITSGQTFDITLQGNEALGIFEINDTTGKNYLQVRTTTGSEATRIAQELEVGTDVRLDEQASGPGGSANTGAVYTKDVSGVTELFYQDSAGTEEQISKAASGDATATVINKTAGENIAAGAPVNLYNNGGSPNIQESDANGAGTRPNCVGLAQAAISSAASGDVVVAGEVDVPDAQWDSVPVVGDVGEPAYVSTTVGNLTLTAPGAGATVVRVGYVSVGGTGAVKVSVNVGEPVKTQ
jgi:hypothetical protein